jgi:hypothetical protein
MAERFTATATRDHDETNPLPVYVLATTVEGTRQALMTANRLTHGGPVAVLAPRRSSAPAEWSEVTKGVRALIADIGLTATVHVCVCRDSADAVRQMLGRSTLLVIGGHGRLFWPTREQRLARRLTGLGYPVVFAQVLPTSLDGGRLEGLFRNSLGASEVTPSIVASEAAKVRASGTEFADPSVVNGSTRPWLLAGIAFVVILALLTIWAWVTRPADGHFATLPLAAAQHSSS